MGTSALAAEGVGALEKLVEKVEKVGRIDLRTGGQGGGFAAPVTKLYTIDAKSPGRRMTG